MSDDKPTGAPTAAEAEMADAMDSIQSTGEDWRSKERATDSGNDRDNEESHDV